MLRSAQNEWNSLYGESWVCARLMELELLSQRPMPCGTFNIHSTRQTPLRRYVCAYCVIHTPCKRMANTLTYGFCRIRKSSIRCTSHRYTDGIFGGFIGRNLSHIATAPWHTVIFVSLSTWNFDTLINSRPSHGTHWRRFAATAPVPTTI